MDFLLNFIFAALWSVFGSDPFVPAQGVQPQWTAVSGWESPGGPYLFKAESSQIPEQCRAQPRAFIDFPMLIHGAHEIFIDGRLALRFSDPSFRSIRSIYGKPSISCRELVTAAKIEWHASTDSKYFARFTHFPSLESKRPADNFFNETLNLGAAATLLTMGIFCTIIFAGKVSNALAFSYLAANSLLAVYFATTVPGLLSLEMDVLSVHRIGDSSLWIGTALLCYVLYLQGLVSRPLLRFFTAVTVCTVALQWFARNGDEAQMGTNLGFIPAFLILSHAIFRLARKKLKGRIGNKLSALQLLGLGTFVIAGMNDALVVMGVFDGFLFYSVGLIAQMFFLALAVHETILDTYRERDYLRGNLEKEVERKTAELRHTQAELIQSAKLASLGTLSAGIAHEINNSINFISGALEPLERIVAKLEPVSPRDFELGRRLLASMKDGTRITVEIVKSLRQFTGLNQAKLKDVRIAEVVQTVRTILHSKLKDSYHVTVEIPENLVLYADVVGFNQILMNLMTNAIDAMPNGGKIHISGSISSEVVTLEVRDSGSGIPEEILNSIFDPFFTTKEVGSGTGLGLYIVKKEVERYAGRVHVHPTSQGTTFQLTFPKAIKEREGAAA